MVEQFEFHLSFYVLLDEGGPEAGTHVVRVEHHGALPAFFQRFHHIKHVKHHWAHDVRVLVQDQRYQLNGRLVAANHLRQFDEIPQGFVQIKDHQVFHILYGPVNFH
jgi:hypothetical protein